MKRVRANDSFHVGSHALRISAVMERLDRHRASVRGSLAPADTMRWAVTVDRIPVERLFSSRPDAWTAGVIEADRLDHLVVPTAHDGGYARAPPVKA